MNEDDCSKTSLVELIPPGRPTANLRTSKHGFTRYGKDGLHIDSKKTEGDLILKFEVWYNVIWREADDS